MDQRNQVHVTSGYPAFRTGPQSQNTDEIQPTEGDKTEAKPKLKKKQISKRSNSPSPSIPKNPSNLLYIITAVSAVVLVAVITIAATVATSEITQLKSVQTTTTSPGETSSNTVQNPALITTTSPSKTSPNTIQGPAQTTTIVSSFETSPDTVPNPTTTFSGMGSIATTEAVTSSNPTTTAPGECASLPCANNGTCTSTINGHTCSCIPGYTGTACETNLDECSSNPCSNATVCVDQVNGYTCSCFPGYTGTQCETDVNECSSDPCLNGGTCIDGINIYSCQCIPGYTGDSCQTDVNECSSAPCFHNGTCIDGINSFRCDCAPPFLEKDFCQSVLILKNDINGSDSYFFNRSWAEFLQPFGDPKSQYWIGLEQLNQIFGNHYCYIHFDLTDINENVYYAQYYQFSTGDSSRNYVIGYSLDSATDGGATSDLAGSPFSTYDADHDTSSGNCAATLGGGYWYDDCAQAQLTASPSDNFKFYNGSLWISLLKASAHFYCYPGT